MSDVLEDSIRVCGLSHYFAVSGFHISVVCMGLYSLLRLMGVPRFGYTAAAMAAMLIYCGAAGFSKSAVRACIMVAVMLICRLLNAKSDTLNSLGLAVFILCLNTFAVTDAGAVLTVCAVLGITVIYRPASLLVRLRSNAVRRIVKPLLFSACVLLAVAPALYLFFSKLSLLSIILNLIIEPVISFFMRKFQ